MVAEMYSGFAASEGRPDARRPMSSVPPMHAGILPCIVGRARPSMALLLRTWAFARRAFPAIHRLRHPFERAHGGLRTRLACVGSHRGCLQTRRRSVRRHPRVSSDASQVCLETPTSVFERVAGVSGDTHGCLRTRRRCVRTHPRVCSGASRVCLDTPGDLSGRAVEVSGDSAGLHLLHSKWQSTKRR